MKRIEKAILPSVRKLAHLMKRDRIYYWSDSRLRELSSTMVMPRIYYRWLHTICLKMADFRTFQRLADKLIHTIPLRIRFEVA
jgi:hypothetical protein